ncbi:MAG: molybdopterin dinucleotide binding domain-containing protein, partial [Promethearchaeota archaeon]
FIAQPYPNVQLQQKVIEPLYESKSDVIIVAELAERLGFGEYFKGGEEGLINLIIPRNFQGMGISRETLKTQAMQLPSLPEGASFPLSFGTPSRKIELYAEQLYEYGEALPVYLPPIEAPITPGKKKYPLTLINVHSRFRTHSMFANLHALLELNPEPIVDIHPIDAEEREIQTGDIVTIYNARARTTLKARVTEGVKPGVLDLTEGWWIEQFREGSLNHLTHDIINPVQNKVYEPNMHMNDVAVEIKKSEG